MPRRPLWTRSSQQRRSMRQLDQKRSRSSGAATSGNSVATTAGYVKKSLSVAGYETVPTDTVRKFAKQSDCGVHYCTKPEP